MLSHPTRAGIKKRRAEPLGAAGKEVTEKRMRPGDGEEGPEKNNSPHVAHEGEGETSTALRSSQKKGYTINHRLKR